MQYWDKYNWYNYFERYSALSCKTLHVHSYKPEIPILENVYALLKILNLHTRKRVRMSVAALFRITKNWKQLFTKSRINKWCYTYIIT